MKMKMIYNSTNKLDRMLFNSQKMLISHLGHEKEKIGPGNLRRGTPIDTRICNVCRRSSEVKQRVEAKNGHDIATDHRMFVLPT
jgi:hypothetical protein